MHNPLYTAIGMLNTHIYTKWFQYVEVNMATISKQYTLLFTTMSACFAHKHTFDHTVCTHGLCPAVPSFGGVHKVRVQVCVCVCVCV